MRYINPRFTYLLTYKVRSQGRSQKFVLKGIKFVGRYKT